MIDILTQKAFEGLVCAFYAEISIPGIFFFS